MSLVLWFVGEGDWVCGQPISDSNAPCSLISVVLSYNRLYGICPSILFGLGYHCVNCYRRLYHKTLVRKYENGSVAIIIHSYPTSVVDSIFSSCIEDGMIFKLLFDIMKGMVLALRSSPPL